MAKSLPPVSAKVIADAEQAIAEFKRFERQAKGTSGRVGAEVDNMAKSLSKKFSLSGVGKDLLKGFGVGSGFSVIDTAINKIGEAYDQHQEKLKKIDDTWRDIIAKSKEYQFSKLDASGKVADLEKQLEVLQQKRVDALKPKEMSGTVAGAFGVTYKATPTWGSTGERLEMATMVSEIATVAMELEKAQKELADQHKKTKSEAEKELIEISKLHTQTWAAMEKNYQAMLADMPEEEFDSRREAIEDMFYSGKIGAEAASKAIKDLDVDQHRWMDHMTKAAEENIKVWREVFETMGDAGMTEAIDNNRKYAEEMKDSMVYFADGVESFLDDAIARGKDMGDVVDDLGNSIASMFLKLAVINPIMNSIFGGSKGWSALPTLFFADGGRPPVGRASVVGERGPELFVPDSAGTIIPNHALQGGGGGNKTFYIDARGADRTGLAQLFAYIRQVDGSIEERSVAANFAASRSNLARVGFMPITYPISLPTSPTSRSIRLRKRTVAAHAPSPFSLVSQVQVSGGQQWSGTVSLPPMGRSSGEPWVAALISLNGIEGSFLAGDTANLLPRGVGTGTPLVKGGSQSGYDLVTDGWTAGVTGILKAGDWLQLGTGATSRLYKVMADANSNGSGESTLTLWPKLRSSPADNAAITISSPKGRFMLAQDVEWDIDEAKIYGLTFDIVEDLRP